MRLSTGPAHKLRPEELKVLNHLAEAWRAFRAIPVPPSGGDDLPDFRYLIHRAQDLVISRPGRRANAKELNL